MLAPCVGLASRMATMVKAWLRRIHSGSIAISFLAGLLFAGLLHLPQFSAAQQAESRYAVRPPARSSATASSSLENLSDAFASVAEHVKPSVVFIKSGRKARVRQPQFQLPPGFEQFFP